MELMNFNLCAFLQAINSFGADVELYKFACIIGITMVIMYYFQWKPNSSLGGLISSKSFYYEVQILNMVWWVARKVYENSNKQEKIKLDKLGSFNNAELYSN